LAQLALASFHGAREELILTTPYFVPGEAEVVSLCTAAKRGVRVRLVVPARNDSPLVQAVSRSHYGRLIDAGVEVFEYQEGLLHAKTLTVDRDLALVTTANFDRRSFDLNFEVSTLVYDTNFASQLRLLQRDYMVRSTLVTLAQVNGRSWLRRFAYNAAGIFSPVL
jgi:cardiolipin synthase